MDAVYGNSIDLGLEVIARKGLARKPWLLMVVNVLLPAFTLVMVRRGCSSFKRRDTCTYTRGSVRRASGFVLTGKTGTRLTSCLQTSGWTQEEQLFRKRGHLCYPRLRISVTSISLGEVFAVSLTNPFVAKGLNPPEIHREG